MENTNTTDAYSIVTNRIIEQLEKQVIPWRKPWAEGGHPRNLLTRSPYHGMNVWMLGSLGYSQNYFLTWKQLKAVGGSVKKGEKGHLVVFWKRVPEHQPVLRYYCVFNIAQCDHLPEILTVPYPQHDISLFGACDEIIERMPNCPAIKHSKAQAFYNPVEDYINMPKQGTFSSAESYYSTLFHELIHSTGHPSRLNRKEVAENDGYGAAGYSIEELTAEIGACYLNSVAGIVNKEFDNSVAYIQGWIEVLKNDKRFIVYASGQAQKAADYILNVQPYANKSVQLEEMKTQ